jgi:hypothetical protein
MIAEPGKQSLQPWSALAIADLKAELRRLARRLGARSLILQLLLCCASRGLWGGGLANTVSRSRVLLREPPGPT